METHENELRRMAREIRKAAIEMSGKYFTLCKYVRENNLTPRTVSTVLKSEGLSRHVCSKINRVANCAEHYWSEYAAREIGFKRVLDMTRDETRTQLADNSSLTVAQITNHSLARTESNKEGKRNKLSDLSEDPDIEAERSVAKLGAWAQANNLKRKKVWNLGNGYVVTVERYKMLPRGNISNVVIAGQDVAT